MQITLRFDEELAIMVKQRKPKRQALAPFCLDLIEQALTGQLTYAPTVSVRETNHSPVNASEPCVAGLAVPAVETAVPLETKISKETIDSTVRKKAKHKVLPSFRPSGSSINPAR